MALSDVLRLEHVGEGDVWHASTPASSRRSDIYGGQVAGQALVAATRTVDPEYLPNSVHSYFLRRGNPNEPLEISVERTRTGRTYATRQVDVRQSGRSIFVMQSSFHTEEPSREFDHPMPAGVPDPDSIPVDESGWNWHDSLDLRTLPRVDAGVRYWCRVTGGFPADPQMQLCALLYVSDLRAGSPAMEAVGYSESGGALVGNFGTLDHSLWFHRVPAVEEWFYCEVRPLTVRDSRGLVFGTMFDRAGRHLASFTQEMFLKVPTAPS